MHPHIEEKKDDYDDDVIASTSTTKADAPHHPHHTITSSNQPNNETNKSRPLLLLLCATGITSCYLWYGTVQEHLFQIDNEGGDDKQSITLFLLATGTFSSFLLALVWIVIGPLLLAQTTDSTSGKEEEISRRDRQVEGNGRLCFHEIMDKYKIMDG